MKIDQNTKLIVRLHRKLDNKGINIYNPYFQKIGLNIIYLLFVNEDPQKLLNGIRNLNIAGAIPAGFERYDGFPQLLDELDPIAKEVNQVGLITQSGGKIKGYYQPPYALTKSIKSLTEIKDKKIIIMGSGHVVRGFLKYIKDTNQQPKKIEIYNRTIQKADNLANRFTFVNKIGDLMDMQKATGDVFINATYIGSRANKGNTYEFTEKFISRFRFVVDVAFVPMNSQLITLANKLNILNSPGWKTWVFQAELCLKLMINHKMNSKVFSKIAELEFSKDP